MADVDVIYATFGDHKLFVGYFCKRILGKPLAVTIHAYELYRNPNLKMFLRALSAADQIITVTEHNREYLAARYRVDPSTVEVVRCGVDTDEYRPERKFTILIVGFFAERKGHEVLFRALRALDDPGIEVWVVGDAGAERPVDVKEAAARLGVESQIAFFGKLGANALSALYRACDVFCLPCHFDSSGVGEGFPVAIIEAMAFGKPVITTRHVEVPRVVPEILVDENDAEGLAAAIRKVQGSLPLRQRLGAQNRQLAEDVFSSGNARKTARILRNLATSPSSAHRRDEGGIVGTAAASV
jgi:glycosyltransferase involved in cell wall biosynthesis